VGSEMYIRGSHYTVEDVVANAVRRETFKP